MRWHLGQRASLEQRPSKDYHSSTKSGNILVASGNKNDIGVSIDGTILGTREQIDREYNINGKTYKNRVKDANDEGSPRRPESQLWSWRRAKENVTFLPTSDAAQMYSTMRSAAQTGQDVATLPFAGDMPSWWKTDKAELPEWANWRERSRTLNEQKLAQRKLEQAGTSAVRIHDSLGRTRALELKKHIAAVNGVIKALKVAVDTKKLN